MPFSQSDFWVEWLEKLRAKPQVSGLNPIGTQRADFHVKKCGNGGGFSALIFDTIFDLFLGFLETHIVTNRIHCLGAKTGGDEHFVVLSVNNSSVTLI